MSKIISYICDKCGKTIKDDENYEIAVERVGMGDFEEECILDIKPVIQDKIMETLGGKNLCEKCLCKLLDNLFEKPDKKIACNLSEAELKEMLISEQLTVQQIADKTGCTYKQIHYRIKKFKLTKKARHEEEERKKVTGEDKLLNPDDVRRDYINNNMTIPELASKYGFSITEMHSFMIKNRIGKCLKEHTDYLRQQGKLNE